jgi:uncharacterized Zn-binding protein involved in type VI secretion|tara:strand:- start:188 stop:478 length:291 start_codon:yes stop_codon:yes gene_type:complete
MSIPIHRDTDSRVCGATTVVENQSSVFANGLLIATFGDPNSHGGGGLIAACNNVYIKGIIVCNHSPDSASADSICPIPPHCNPATASGSSNVFVGD